MCDYLIVIYEIPYIALKETTQYHWILLNMFLNERNLTIPMAVALIPIKIYQSHLYQPLTNLIPFIFGAEKYITFHKYCSLNEA